MLRQKNVELIQNLNELIKKYSRNDKVRKIIMDEFTSRNMKASIAINILNENLLLSALDIDTNKDLILLFVFTRGMYDALTHKEDGNQEPLGEIEEGLSIVPSDYFTEIEMDNLIDYKLEKVSNNSEEVIFPKMIKTASGLWTGNISSKYLAELDAGNELIYNFKTQRDPVIDVFGMKRIHLNKTNVREMKEGLLSGEQFPTAIVINLLHDGTDEVFFSEKSGDLKVIGIKNLVDGQHRKIANSLAIEEDPGLDFNWILVVTNYSEIKAQKYMVEINKQMPMKPEHVKNMDTSSLGNIVVDAMKDIRTSEFAEKIKENDREIEHGGLTKKSILAIAIEECYVNELKDKLKIRTIAKHIANVMDVIIGLNVNEFIVNPEETKKISFINNKNVFAGYVALSEKLYHDKDWEIKIEQALSEIDFSKDNEQWKNIGSLDEQDMSKSTRKNLYKFFRNAV